jgi:DNA-binding PadR family transcriptional regulator
MAKPMDESLPLTETTFFILLSLAQQPRHGYAIMKDVESLSEQRVQFSTGTLYGALRRLLGDGWIERVAEGQDDSLRDERNRKYYSLTDQGKWALEAELDRMQQLIRVAKLRRSELPA